MNHPERDTRYECNKHKVHMCEACLDCRDPDIDIIDRSPLLDIKPFVPEFDTRNAVRIGWLEKKIADVNKTLDDGRFKV